MEIDLTGLRVLRAVAETGSFTAAATSLGYTQSAVSRRVAALERATAAKLFDRGRKGARLTSEGRILLRHAAAALDALDDAERELGHRRPEEQVLRVGAFASAGGALLPSTLTRLRRRLPALRVETREATTPRLLRSLRAETLDVVLITSRPPHRAPDGEDPPLHLEALADTELRVAVSEGDPLASATDVPLERLGRASWIATPPSANEPQLGVWPGLSARPRMVHLSRDWLTKLQLVRAGCGVTTVPAFMAPVIPDGVRLVRVADAPKEVRRLSLVRLPGPEPAAVSALADALRQVLPADV